MATAAPATPAGSESVTTVNPAARASPDDDADRRLGTTAGVAAYTLWGLFPLVFHRLRSVSAVEILLHRVVWSFAVVMVLLLVRGDRDWYRAVRHTAHGLRNLTVAAVLIATNWLVYIWAVNHDHVIEAALGYYVNPLITVALGVWVLGEHLRRVQMIALGFGAAAVGVLTIAYGRVPWIALVLACTFAGYGFLKKAVAVEATTSLAVETAVLLPAAIVGMAVMQVQGEAAFGHGSIGRDALLISLGVVTAVPLLLFATAASRIPLSLLGLLQYLTPTMQLLCGVVVFHEPMPAERLVGFVLVWVALILLGVDALRTARRRADQPIPIIEPA
jgi:chloramphenicol-sensitive protein RarD